MIAWKIAPDFYTVVRNHSQLCGYIDIQNMKVAVSFKAWRIYVPKIFNVNLTFMEVNIVHTYECTHAFLSVNFKKHVSDEVGVNRLKTCGHRLPWNEFINAYMVFIYVRQFFSIQEITVRFRFQILSKSNQLNDILDGHTINMKPYPFINTIPFMKYRVIASGVAMDFRKWKIVNTIGFRTVFTEVWMPCKFGSFSIFDGPILDEKSMDILNCTQGIHKHIIETTYFICTVVFSPSFYEHPTFYAKYQEKKISNVSFFIHSNNVTTHIIIS